MTTSSKLKMLYELNKTKWLHLPTSTINNDNCKLEFYQTSCWLYSVPNLLIF